jgi:beta-glucosidase
MIQHPGSKLSATSDLKFPAGFLWGVSTAAFQVEGSGCDSQWARWEAAGRIRTGDRSGDACGWWKNAEDDFAAAKQLGVNALRLSVEWSRLEPSPGQWDRHALQRYRQMLQSLHDHGILPIVCLHHFTHPAWFEAEGGFLNPDAPRRFEHFSRRVVEDLSDLCNHWVTFNEPNVFAAFGYVVGEFPPGGKGRILAAIRAIRGMAKAHARVYHRIHEIQPQAEVGWAQHYAVFHPARQHSRLDQWTTMNLNTLFNETFLRTIESGTLGFPFDLLDGDVQEAMATCDFVGLNVYSRFHVAFSPRHFSQMCADVFVPSNALQGDSCVDRPYGEVYPDAIAAAVTRASRLKKPIYILESGVPDAADRIRPWFLVNVIKQLHKLIVDGHDIRGYFHWTLTDNFEWIEGWGLRFGLIELNPATQERKLRPSAHLFRAMAQSNSIPAELLAQFDKPVSALP